MNGKAVGGVAGACKASIAPLVLKPRRFNKSSTKNQVLDYWRFCCGDAML